MESEIDAVIVAMSNGEEVHVDRLKVRIQEIKATACKLEEERDAWVKRCNDLDTRIDNLRDEVKENKKKTDELLQENKETRNELKEYKKKTDACLRQIMKCLSEYFNDV